MQWKSFVFLFAAAGSAVARSHGNHNHRHGARHQHDSNAVANHIHEEEPVTVTETAWACCTSSALSSSIPPAPATFIETSSSTQTAIETPTSTPTPTPTPEPTSEEPTSSETPTPTPEPETTSSSTSTVAPTSTEKPTSTEADHSQWTKTPSSGDFCLDGFGERTSQLITGNKDTYAGNVGTPWGSNMVEVSAEKAADYKYVVQFHGSKTDSLFVAIWNKIGPDMKMTGWYNGNAAIEFTLQPNEIRYVAFDENSQGSWGAAKGDSLPVDAYGGYSCTWGEFDLGSSKNNGWSGWDASIIQAEAARAAKALNQPEILGMKICAADGTNCSIIGRGGSIIKDAYAFVHRWIDGIGGKVPSGPVRMVAHLDYDE